MIKKSIYPKTKRITNSNNEIIITEKLDGSNIGFFKLDVELLIATRNNIIKYSELETVKNILYKDLYSWLIINGVYLKDSLNEGSGFFGEWLGMGKLKYNDLDKKVYIFAKANINKKFDTYNIFYDSTLFKHSFCTNFIPDFLGIVPPVEILSKFPTISDLDNLYEKYVKKVKRNVEGFVIEYKNSIFKYVRMKNGKLETHKE